MARRLVNDCFYLINTSLNKEEDHNNSEQTKKKKALVAGGREEEREHSITVEVQYNSIYSRKFSKGTDENLKLAKSISKKVSIQLAIAFFSQRARKLTSNRSVNAIVIPFDVLSPEDQKKPNLAGRLACVLLLVPCLRFSKSISRDVLILF